VVAASGGNHGVAVAYAAKVPGKPATIFVPTVTSPAKIERIRGYGAGRRGGLRGIAVTGIPAACWSAEATPPPWISPVDESGVRAGVASMGPEFLLRVAKYRYHRSMKVGSPPSIHGPWGFHACEECEFLTDAYIRAMDRQNAANRRFLEAVGLHDTSVLNARFMEGEQCLLVLRDIVLELYHHRRRTDKGPSMEPGG
jgi:hypothetical protein